MNSSEWMQAFQSQLGQVSRPDLRAKLLETMVGYAGAYATVAAAGEREACAQLVEGVYGRQTAAEAIRAIRGRGAENGGAMEWFMAMEREACARMAESLIEDRDEGTGAVLEILAANIRALGRLENAIQAGAKRESERSAEEKGGPNGAPSIEGHALGVRTRSIERHDAGAQVVSGAAGSGAEGVPGSVGAAGEGLPGDVPADAG